MEEHAAGRCSGGQARQKGIQHCIKDSMREHGCETAMLPELSAAESQAIYQSFASRFSQMAMWLCPATR